MHYNNILKFISTWQPYEVRGVSRVEMLPLYTLILAFLSAFQAANLRSLLLKRYFGDNYPKIMEASEDKTSQTKNTSVRGDTRILKRAGVTLAEMQCQLNSCGATDLVIDIIMKKPSYHVFVECIKLGISLLEGGNHLIQVYAIYSLITTLYIIISIIPT